MKNMGFLGVQVGSLAALSGSKECLLYGCLIPSWLHSLCTPKKKNIERSDSQSSFVNSRNLTISRWIFMLVTEGEFFVWGWNCLKMNDKWNVNWDEHYVPHSRVVYPSIWEYRL